MKRRTFIKVGSLSIGLLTLKSNPLYSIIQDNKTVYLIKIVYNNISGNNELEAAGGFSAWIETKDNAIIFDAGGDNLVLANNIEKSGIDISKAYATVISHNHWDHVYGLPSIAYRTKNSTVYVPESFKNSIHEQNPRINLVSVKEPQEIVSGIWTTGEIFTEFMNRKISEQSIVINKPNDIAVLTGCAHPGIVKIVKKSADIFPNKKIHLVAGGFHLRNYSDIEVKKISNELKSMGVENVAPSHCTGTRAIEIFKEEWGNHFIELNLGDEFRF
ncbi:MBL fold metallo-hydrolase [Bacteroidota bacterium]